jgi:hypothetical protein
MILKANPEGNPGESAISNRSGLSRPESPFICDSESSLVARDPSTSLVFFVTFVVKQHREKKRVG